MVCHPFPFFSTVKNAVQFGHFLSCLEIQRKTRFWFYSASDSSATAPWREAICVQRVRARLSAAVRPHCALAHAHRGDALPLRPVPQVRARGDQLSRLDLHCLWNRHCREELTGTLCFIEPGLNGLLHFRSFNSKYTLKIHLMVHKNQRDFACEECGRRYARPYPLTVSS